jgi:hypothetical protein
MIMGIGGVFSLPHPQDGQDARSSGNFNFEIKPEGNIRVEFVFSPVEPGNSVIICNLVWDRTARSDEVVTPITHGFRFPGSKIELDRGYYIASPVGAVSGFTVEFFQD